MSSTTDIEMAYSPDGSDALTSSHLLKTTNADLLKMLLEMKKENTHCRALLEKEISFKKEWCFTVAGASFPIFFLSLFILIMVAENNRGLYINGDKNRFRCNFTNI